MAGQSADSAILEPTVPPSATLPWPLSFPFAKLCVLRAMYFNRLAHTAYLSRLGSRTSLRMASTILGASGREYIQGEVLQRDPKDNKPRIFKAGYVQNRMCQSLARWQDSDYAAQVRK